MKRLIFKSSLLIVLLTCNLILVQAQDYPVSDPTNAGGWIANNYLSDEFNGTTLDKTKWWILGEDGDYRSKWKGRAPGQFAPNNVRVENGDLILSTKWEPSFTFLNEKQDGTFYGGTATAADKSMPITQACILSERFFKYGYMEVRCKLADAPVTGAFWTTGYHSEIDMVENYGKRPIGNPKNQNADLEKKYRTNIINWDPETTSTSNWKKETVLAERVASDYFVYGFEWDKDYVKIYFNGTLIRQATRQELETADQWRLFYPQEVWLDTEVFSWYGLPAMADLNTPAEFKIDYVRIWQKEITPPNFDALGFEGPFNFQGRSSNWYSAGTVNWRMKNDKAATGDLSLRFKNTGTLSGNYTMYSPYGAINLPTGSNEIKMKVWIDPSITVNKIRVILNNPFANIDLNISGVEKGKWVEVSKTFSRASASNLSLTNGDRIAVQLQSGDVTGSNILLYVDDISFKFDNSKVLDIPKVTEHSFQIFPNPTKENLTIVSPDNGKIKIYNSLGTIVKKVEKTSESQTFSVSDLAKGIYFMTLTNANSVTTKSQKLIVQ
ncbi:T9SS type A sorting domain-containing protein [Flavobacterium sp.]|uniref:T9SS type A sorting domain-containing protein n=1 Tax=Flavobacterium sp. TaxID=239 RepID=UPI003C5E141F